MNLVNILICLTFLITNVNSRKIGRCQLAKILKANGIPKQSLPNWICLAEAESLSNTSMVSNPFCDGHKAYGIFQIDNRTWCSGKGLGNGCKMNCKNFLDDDIRDDLYCAKKIHNLLGFDAWKKWKNNCKGKPLPNISKCGI